MDRLIDLCHAMCINRYNWEMPEAFLFQSIDDYTHISVMNKQHTILFKIRVKHDDLGVWFKHPCVLQTGDAINKKLKLERLNLEIPYHKHYLDLLNFYDVFDIDYDTVKYRELSRFFSKLLDADMLEIRNREYHNIYSTRLLENAILTDDVDDIHLRLNGQDLPLRLNYRYGLFEVYCLVAPKIECNTPFFLRV